MSSSDRYFNDKPYPLIQGDTKPAYVFSIYDSAGIPADLSGYDDLVLTARFREKGAATSLAAITCVAVDKSVGQFQITIWPEAVAEAEEGKHELEFQLDYLGDGTQVQTVFNLIQFKIYEQFGAAS